MRKHNRLSVRPHVDYVVSKYPDKPIQITIVNMGLGPAIVSRFLLHLDKVEYEVQEKFPNEILNELLKTGLKINWDTITPNTPIAVGGNFTPISVNDSFESVEKHNSAITLLNRFGFTLKYKSLYEETFEVRYDGSSSK